MNLYPLLITGAQHVSKAVSNSYDFIRGQYAIKKEKAETERNLEAVANDYTSRVSEPKFSVSDDEEIFDSLPGC